MHAVCFSIDFLDRCIREKNAPLPEYEFRYDECYIA